MTTWANPIRHPWLDTPNLKRKADNEAGEGNVFNSPPVKRRRWDALEHGFAGLSINTLAAEPQWLRPQPQPQPQPQSQPQHSLHGCPSGSAFLTTPSYIPDQQLFRDGSTTITPEYHGHISSPVLPSSVDEPVSPEVIDVKMKGTSWYEPERDRVVVTDLDDFADDSDDETSQSDLGVIAPIYLDHIRSHNPFLSSWRDLHTTDPEEGKNKALVLFRPPTYGTAAKEEDTKHIESLRGSKSLCDTSPTLSVHDNDAMDVEI